MRKLYTTLGVLGFIALTLSLLGPLGIAEAGASHTGKGTVLSVDINGSRISMTEEPGGSHVLSLNHQTRIVDEIGSPITATALQPGDLIREECLVAGNGAFVVKQIRRLRPAWAELASPEM